MAYDKNTWKSGDVVTSAKLNNIENGIANMNGTITMNIGDTTTLSVSYNEVLAMLDNGIVPFVYMYMDEGHGDARGFVAQVVELQASGGEYGATFFDGSSLMSARALDPDAKLEVME